MRSAAYTGAMETPESRRKAGETIHTARRATGMSQRALARAANISETWLRALTIGLAGGDPQRAADETWIALATAVGVDTQKLFEELGRPLPEVAPPEDEPDSGERFSVEHTTYEGRVLEIVRDLELDTDDLPDEVADEIIRRSVEHMAAQARLMVETERRRWERQRDA